MTKAPPAARISWKLFPPSVLSSKTPPSKPRLGSSPDASRLKLCRKVKDKGAGGSKIASESSILSLTTAGSSINAALGSVSAGGIGTPESDVTHNGGGPWALLAIQSGGNPGGITSSKFSLNCTGWEQGNGEHEELGDGAGTAADMSTRPQPTTLFGGPGVPHCL